MKQRFSHNLANSAATAGIALALVGAIATTSASAQTYLSQTATKTPRPTDEIKFESQSVSNSFINIENGPLVVTPIKEEAWSSRWYVEPVGEGDFVRIKNRWTGCYLNTEQGPLVCGPQQAGWWSAQWRLVPDVDVKYSIINRWTDCKLTNSGQGLRCMKNDRNTADNLWRPMNLTPETIKPKPVMPSTVQASEPPPAPGIPGIDKAGSGVFSTSDGWSHDDLILRSTSSRPRLGGNLDEDIETVDVYGQYTEVIGYEHPNFTGRTVTLRCGHYELIGDPENEISSIKVRVAERPTPAENCTGGTSSSGFLIVSDGETRVEIHNWDR